MQILVIFSFICMVCRCVIFKKRDARWWQGMIPAYNTYKLGKLCGAKKIGLTSAILQTVLFVYFFFCFGFELYLMQKFAVNIDTTTYENAYVVVPELEANIAIVSKYILIALAAVTFGFWCIMMWQFIKVHKKSAWWILPWAIIPVVPYAVFAVSNDVYIDGQLYTSKRVVSTDKKVKTK